MEVAVRTLDPQGASAQTMEADADKRVAWGIAKERLDAQDA